MDDIVITLKLYSGLEKDLGIPGYDADSGITIRVKKGIRLKKIITDSGLQKLSGFAFFSGGERITLRRKFNESSEVSCLKISGGG
jgi:hypothetical protein